MELPNVQKDFLGIPLEFQDGAHKNVFADKNNKTVAETLEHPKYQHLADHFYEAHSELLELPLGTALMQMKDCGDDFYLRFLNKYGDLVYSVFRLADSSHGPLKGVYAFFVQEKLVYIGRCKDSIKKRIDQGYGKIHPKNCYKDGQATNCRLNNLITQVGDHIQLRLCVIDDGDIIELVEREFIRKHNLIWNIQRS
jgi:hypothetical protein